jgi:hypothetical protein
MVKPLKAQNFGENSYRKADQLTAFQLHISGILSQRSKDWVFCDLCFYKKHIVLESF